MLLASLEPRCCAKLFERGVAQPQLGSTIDTIDPVTMMQVGRRNRPEQEPPPEEQVREERIRRKREEDDDPDPEEEDEEDA